jgi:hypothetical protein
MKIHEMVKEEIMTEYINTLIKEEISEKVTRFRNTNVPGFSVVVRFEPHFQVLYDVYEGDQLIETIFNDQIPVEDELFKIFAGLNGEWCDECDCHEDDCECE